MSTLFEFEKIVDNNIIILKTVAAQSPTLQKQTQAIYRHLYGCKNLQIFIFLHNL